MMKKFFAVLVLILISSVSYALTEEEYNELMNDSAFSAADREMNQVWSSARKSLSKEEFDSLRNSQREWSRTGRDEEAEDLIDINGYSKARAYTIVTQNRTAEIRSMIDAKNKKTPEPGIVKADKDYVTVIAKGEGANRSEALEASWTEAVRIAVGMIISSKSELNNDELNENIITHSRGAVEDFDILDEQVTKTGTQVVIQARVHREVLEDVTKTYTEAQKVEADTGAVAEVFKGLENEKAKEKTIQAKQKSGAELLKEVLDSYGPENFFSATLDPKIKFTKNKKPYIQVNEKFNQEVFWKEFIPKLHKALEGVAVNKTKRFYVDEVRKANQRLPKEGFFAMRGIVRPNDWLKGEVHYRDRKTNKDVRAYMPYYVLGNDDDKVYQVVVPHDNASFTVYAMPFRGTRGTDSLNDFYAKNYTVNPDDSITEEGAAMLLSFIQFTQRMCRPVTYALSYLDKSEEVITNQIIRTGPRAFGVYRSFSGNQYLNPNVMFLAPGYVNGDNENPVYGINPAGKFNVFLGTGNYNKAHPEEGYEVELDTEELKQLNSMKFEIIFENQ